MAYRVYRTVFLSEKSSHKFFESGLYRKLWLGQLIKGEKKGRLRSKASLRELFGNEWTIILRIAEP